MGNRAIVVFHDQNGIAPAACYLHWAGSEVRELLDGAAPRMRSGDALYAAARFIGHCHVEIDGCLGLGIVTAPKKLDPKSLASYSHGDAGVFVVDCRTGQVTQFLDSYAKEAARDKYPPMRAQEPFTIALGVA